MRVRRCLHIFDDPIPSRYILRTLHICVKEVRVLLCDDAADIIIHH